MKTESIVGNPESDIQAWASHVLANNRVTDADLTSLHDATMFGVPARSDLESLFRVERSIMPTEPRWADLLCALVTDHVVWGERPAGTVTPDKADWLLQQIRRTGTATCGVLGLDIAEAAPRAPAWFIAAVTSRQVAMSAAA